MENRIRRERKIMELKKELVSKYFYIMQTVLLCYLIYFKFFLKSDFMFYYMLAGLTGLSLAVFIVKRSVPIEKIISGYMIIAPLFSFVIILFFWKFTVTNFVWLIPIPIGAYIFFSSKEVIGYSLYGIIIIIAAAVVSNYTNIQGIEPSRNSIRVSDIFLFASNILVVGHLLFYQNKISSLMIITQLEKIEKIELPVSLDKTSSDQYAEQYNDIFERIEVLMREKQVYRNPDFNISALSTMLKVSNSYISRAIRHQNYPNFNNYLNTFRIEFVVNLIHNTNMEKLTMLYIYTEAGYKNQSTFNKAFKEFKGSTPSEYIQKINFNK